MQARLGAPRTSYSQNCQPVTNTTLARRMVTRNVGPFSVTGLDSAVASLTTIMTSIASDQRLVYRVLGTAGMHCARYVAARPPTSPITRGHRPRPHDQRHPRHPRRQPDPVRLTPDIHHLQPQRVVLGGGISDGRRDAFRGGIGAGANLVALVVVRLSSLAKQTLQQTGHANSSFASFVDFFRVSQLLSFVVRWRAHRSAPPPRHDAFSSCTGHIHLSIIARGRPTSRVIILTAIRQTLHPEREFASWLDAAMLHRRRDRDSSTMVRLLQRSDGPHSNLRESRPYLSMSRTKPHQDRPVRWLRKPPSSFCRGGETSGMHPKMCIFPKLPSRKSNCHQVVAREVYDTAIRWHFSG